MKTKIYLPVLMILLALPASAFDRVTFERSKIKSEFINDQNQSIAVVTSSIKVLLPHVFDPVLERSERLELGFYDNDRLLACAIYPDQHIHFSPYFEDENWKRSSDDRTYQDSEAVLLPCKNLQEGLYQAAISFRQWIGIDQEILGYQMHVKFYKMDAHKFLGSTRLSEIKLKNDE